MKKPFTDSSFSLQCQHFLRPKRIIIKFPKLHCPNGLSELEVRGSFWVRGRLLGKGGFGSVFLAKLVHGTHIAVKSSFLKDSPSLQLEKKVLDDLKSCSNVVQCYGDEITKSVSGKQVYNLLLEFCSGGSLHDRIAEFGSNGLSELEVRRYTRDIVYGIKSIHEHGYIHCDIKPDNILLIPSFDDQGRCLVAKIADFGLAMMRTNVVNIDEDNIRGTQPYIAPESLRDNYIDWPVDIWALGCVVLEMLTGKQVWRSKHFDLDMFKFIDHSYELSPMAIDFLRRCLVRNPYKRLQARLLLNHPFIYDLS